jgi:hypothetical protein
MPETTETSNFETDAFLRLLTDALRAGPASPEWHDAVARLRQSGAAEADDYRLLISARENLESGREYRSVRAGPGFTRKVMQEIDQEAAGRTPGAAPTSILAIAAIVGILAVIVVVTILLYRGGVPTGTIADLTGTYFARASVSSDFAQGIGPDWRTVPLIPEITPKGLHGGTRKDAKDYQSGGIVAATAIAANDPFSFETTLRTAKPGDQTVVQLFVSDETISDQKTESSLHEFVCFVKDGQFSVAKPDGSLDGRTAEAKDLNHLAIKFDSRFAIVELDGVQLYAGPHGLNTEKPRYVGLRFLTKGEPKPGEEIIVQSIRILRP